MKSYATVVLRRERRKGLRGADAAQLKRQFVDADVIVIGAGAAGLAATRELKRHSQRVLVLEARQRIGGRVWPVDFADAGAAAELGAEFIHGPAPETRELLRDAGVAVVPTAGDAWICDDSGGLQNAGDDLLRGGAIFEQARSLLADESVDSFLRGLETQGTAQKVLDAARAFVEGFDAADPAIASAKAIADEWFSGVDFASARPVGGYTSLLDRLYNDCRAAGAGFSLGTTVRRISWQRGEVSIGVTSTAGETKTILARAVILTLPIGVMRHSGDQTAVTFEPILPQQKHAALASIEMGHAIKVTLRFRTAFWEAISGGAYRDAGFFRCPAQSFPVYWTQVPLRSALIVAWAGGPKASALSGLSEGELVDRALDGFARVIGDSALTRNEFEAGIVHDWSADPFARGAYSYVRTGGGEARVKLAAPVEDTLFFAGEATATDGQGGTVNGALETGNRAARAVLSAFER